LTAVAFQMVDGGPDASVLVEHVPYPIPLLIGERTEVDCLVALTQTLDAEDPGRFLTAAPPLTVAAFAVGAAPPGGDDQQLQSHGVEVEGDLSSPGVGAVEEERMTGLGHDGGGLVDDSGRRSDEVVLCPLCQQHLLPVVQAEIEDLVESDENSHFESMRGRQPGRSEERRVGKV